MITQDSSSVDQEPDQTADHAPSPVTSTKPSRTPEINVSSEPPRLRFKRQDPPAPAKNMLPETVKNQPLLFFDRGMDTEHYGFHMYYAKTIRVTSTTDPASSDPAGGLSSNVEAGTDVKWERTRFKVVIWTKKRSDGRVELIDPQGNRVQASVNVDGGSGLPKAIQEKFGEEGRCLCEWRNWRAKS
ncbi:hypothetical protein L873DRAFT_1822069 [Choiromyces venosus 120613-1]|uniref:Uncharacterized protein n=1 Tax=Choiromyces venosus 120613-1 TaxID=1336337 RepID=A0A3N4IUN6_9PEZI|nr:hypothetical protein L873DRAFT_1822069 [Choiromyces venosus 120613-1]